MKTEPRSTNAPDRGRWTGPGLWMLLCAVLWTAGALHRSLWVDEFHLLHHLRMDGLAATLASLRTDNHPPLAFLLVGLSRAAFGEGALALRLPSLMAGVLFVRVLWRLGRRFGARTGSRLTGAPTIVAASSYAFLIFSEARMYALLALSTAALLEVALDSLEGRRRIGRVALWVAIGFHSHYYFLHTGFALLLAGGLLAVLEPARRPDLRRLLLGAALGALIALPWYAWALPHQLTHGLPTGGQHGGLADLVRGYGHLFFIHASLAGDWASKLLVLPGTALALVAVLLGAWRIRPALAPGRDPERGPALFLLALGLGLPLMAWGFSQFFPRASYGWRYLAGASGPLYVLAATGLAAGPGRFLAPPLLAAMAAVTAINLQSPGAEDYRGATRYVLERAEAGDCILLKGVWSQDQEHSLTGWDYYLDRTEHGAPGAPVPNAVRVERYREVLGASRVWVLARYRYPSEALAALETRFGPPEFRRISQAISVRLYRIDDDAASGDGSLDPRSQSSEQQE